ncbi:DUF3375 domain-containing protein [Georgenia sp. TF02-10]|uniref:DUF3375 domain-containing protein n=1 Tax=Georgenia sp. TF02-10 TaxID=2917725 RepID=UPI001FA7696E|nr:DUF3375 domain-containing protein [Georgenia sp. TF02-10]UNX55172.1 DUF3375 domain-containing protein [Georgenia sp. TF02-10]
MSVLHSALAAQRLIAESPAWSLLRAQHAGPMVAILGAHLAGEDKRLPAPVLFERVEEDLALLRDHGLDLPQTAQAYCAAWREAGFLIRRAAEGARDETFELSEGALTAIRFVNQLAAPRQSVTESRLSLILERVRALAVETDPDATSRLAALREQRDRLDAEIERVAAGDFEVLPADRAMERVLDILGLAAEIPADFARVRAEMEQINRSLRERLIEQAETRGAVLEDIFRGVDHLAESDAGRSFNGFYSLVLDAERATAFEDDVANVLERAFADGLTAEQARVLRRMLPALQDSSGEIHDVMTAFSRSLRRFVQSQQFQEDRRINTLLRQALGEAMRLSEEVPPFRRTSLTLDLSAVPLDSVAVLRPHNPADSETVEDVTAREAPPVDVARLRELARASEIDLKELTRNVNDVLRRRGPVTIGEVLAEHPATQGVASVVGLLVLAEQHGAALTGAETVRWVSGTGVPRVGSVPLHLFEEAVP